MSTVWIEIEFFRKFDHAKLKEIDRIFKEFDSKTVSRKSERPQHWKRYHVEAKEGLLREGIKKPRWPAQAIAVWVTTELVSSSV